jgi:hypothetical protein
MKRKKFRWRKKTRGFKRHLRDHQQRAATPVKLIDFQTLAQYHYESEWLGLAPWRVSDKPPLPIRRLWVAHLIAGFFSWQQSLQDYPDDYFLAVRIKEPDFADSRLNVGIKEWKTRYDNAYSEPEEMLPLPQEYRDIPGVNALHWTTHRQTYHCSLEDFQYDQQMGMKVRHYWPYEDDDGSPMVLVQIGWVWVGQAPAVALGV